MAFPLSKNDKVHFIVLTLIFFSILSKVFIFVLPLSFCSLFSLLLFLLRSYCFDILNNKDSFSDESSLMFLLMSLLLLVSILFFLILLSSFSFSFIFYLSASSCFFSSSCLDLFIKLWLFDEFKLTNLTFLFLKDKKLL